MEEYRIRCEKWTSKTRTYTHKKRNSKTSYTKCCTSCVSIWRFRFPFYFIIIFEWICSSQNELVDALALFLSHSPECVQFQHRHRHQRRRRRYYQISNHNMVYASNSSSFSTFLIVLFICSKRVFYTILHAQRIGRDTYTYNIRYEQWCCCWSEPGHWSMCPIQLLLFFHYIQLVSSVAAYLHYDG